MRTGHARFRTQPVPGEAVPRRSSVSSAATLQGGASRAAAASAPPVMSSASDGAAAAVTDRARLVDRVADFPEHAAAPCKNRCATSQGRFPGRLSTDHRGHWLTDPRRAVRGGLSPASTTRTARLIVVRGAIVRGRTTAAVTRHTAPAQRRRVVTTLDHVPGVLEVETTHLGNDAGSIETWLQRPRDGASRDRTGDLLLAKQALSQLSYGPASGEFSGGRIGDPAVPRRR